MFVVLVYVAVDICHAELYSADIYTHTYTHTHQPGLVLYTLSSMPTRDRNGRMVGGERT